MRVGLRRLQVLLLEAADERDAAVARDREEAAADARRQPADAVARPAVVVADGGPPPELHVVLERDAHPADAERLQHARVRAAVAEVHAALAELRGAGGGGSALGGRGRGRMGAVAAAFAAAAAAAAAARAMQTQPPCWRTWSSRRFIIDAFISGSVEKSSASSARRKWTGMWPTERRIVPSSGSSKSVELASVRKRPSVNTGTNAAKSSVSKKDVWFAIISTGRPDAPSSAVFLSPCSSMSTHGESANGHRQKMRQKQRPKVCARRSDTKPHHAKKDAMRHASHRHTVPSSSQKLNQHG